MSWLTTALLLLGCAALGALAGAAPARARTWLLAVGVAVVGFFVFLPGSCATAIASVPYGDPQLLEGRTSCWTLYGAAVPELGPLDAEVTGRLLQLAAVVLGVGAVLVVRRR